MVIVVSILNRVMCISCRFCVANLSFFVASKTARATNLIVIHQFLATAIAFVIVTGSVTGTTCIQHTSSHSESHEYNPTISIITAGLHAERTPLNIFLGLAASNHIDFTDCSLSSIVFHIATCGQLFNFSSVT